MIVLLGVTERDLLLIEPQGICGFVGHQQVEVDYSPIGSGLRRGRNFRGKIVSVTAIQDCGLHPLRVGTDRGERTGLNYSDCFNVLIAIVDPVFRSPVTRIGSKLSDEVHYFHYGYRGSGRVCSGISPRGGSVYDRGSRLRLSDGLKQTGRGGTDPVPKTVFIRAVGLNNERTVSTIMVTPSGASGTAGVKKERRMRGVISTGVIIDGQVSVKLAVTPKPVVNRGHELGAVDSELDHVTNDTVEGGFPHEETQRTDFLSSKGRI